MMIELVGHQSVMTFDDRTVEQYGVQPGRAHVTLIEKIDSRTDRKGRITLDVGAYKQLILGVRVDGSMAPLVDQLVAEVNRVRVEDYGLDPV